MRRMYSEKELTTIINQVVGEYIEAGALDDSIADAVDAYLVEHPVDITALEGQTIAPAVVNATTSISAPVLNGENAKPLYYHPIVVYPKSGANAVTFSLVIIGQKSTAFTSFAELVQWCLDNNISYLAPLSGAGYDSSANKLMICAWAEIRSTYVGLIGHYVDDTGSATYRQMYINNTDYDDYELSDSVNKVNS